MDKVYKTEAVGFREIVFFLWTVSIILILIEYCLSETGCASIFMQRKASYLVDPLPRAVLRHWAP
jgi:hypothetical protein